MNYKKRKEHKERRYIIDVLMVRLLGSASHPVAFSFPAHPLSYFLPFIFFCRPNTT